MLMAIMMTMIMQAKTRRTNAESKSRRAAGWWLAASRDMVWGDRRREKTGGWTVSRCFVMIRTWGPEAETEYYRVLKGNVREIMSWAG